ncbi:MAG TPA: DUF885 family protein [Fimbriimonadaceae bacterium]|nr:DUF885 family protein [Fimbriimonadaceae bacterium]
MPASLVALSLLLLTSSNQTMPRQTDNRLVPFIDRLRTDLDELRSFYDLPTSAETSSRMDSFFAGEGQALQAFAGLKRNSEEEVDYALSDKFLSYRRKQIEIELGKVKETEALLPFAGEILALETDRRKLLPIDEEKAADKLTQIAKDVKAVRESLQKAIDSKGKLPSAVLADRSAKRLDRLNQTLDFWFKQYDGFNPLFSWWTKKPYDALATSLRDYSKFLKEKLAGYREGEDPPLIGDPIGREALLVDIDAEMLDKSPEDLLKMADEEFVWCEKEIKAASRQMGFGDDWKKAMEKVKSLHVQPGEQDQLVAAQAKEAIKYVEDHDLVTIEPLCKETWRVEMLNQETQKVLPFAVYLGQRMGVSFPLSTQDHETKEMSLRGNNEHFTRAITFHELIPGHHLQGYMAERYNSHRRLFSTPFLVEGWALYWEMLLWDLGFPRGPEDKIGMLFWRMHRCARIIVSLKFHLGQMKPTEMIDFLVDRVGHERFTATSEVRRFIGGDYSPLYQCAYMIGGLQIRELKKELVDGKKMSLKEFHDAVLHSGPIPIKWIGNRLRHMESPAKGSNRRYL